jgi:hypothetical protein
MLFLIYGSAFAHLSKSVRLDSAQHTDPVAPGNLNEADLRVNDIRLHMPYEEVLRRFGSPERTERARVLVRSCGGRYSERTLFYPGVKLTLYGTPAKRNFRVVMIAVTSPDFELGLGLRLGMHEDKVIEQLGEPGLNMAESGRRLLLYKTRGNTALVGMTFRGRRLFTIDFSVICEARRHNNSNNVKRN